MKFLAIALGGFTAIVQFIGTPLETPLDITYTAASECSTLWGMYAHRPDPEQAPHYYEFDLSATLESSCETGEYLEGFDGEGHIYPPELSDQENHECSDPGPGWSLGCTTWDMNISCPGNGYLATYMHAEVEVPGGGATKTGELVPCGSPE